ncbi:MAG TPA: hypothetical protein VKE49_02405, partial [Myxococcaceae bacterium]|nr:hypothetical protein [Myxococcaceae bacterium]
VAALKLRYTDLLKNAPADSAATLSASVSKDQQEVLSKRDKEAVIFGARAQSAWNTQRAAEALERGDLPRAKRYLKVSEGILADAEGGVEGGVPGGSLGVVLSEGREEQKKLFNAVSAPAASPEQISDQVKAAKSSALKGMGHIGSTY